MEGFEPTNAQIALLISVFVLLPIFLKSFISDLRSSKNTERPSSALISRYEAYKALFATLLFILLDYLAKIYIFARNLLYFPIGVDHRIFKRNYVKLEFGTVTIKLKRQENYFYLGLRGLYTLICIATYAIAIWLFHSMSNTFAPFVVDRNKLLLYSLITACAVFLCDVSITLLSG